MYITTMRIKALFLHPILQFIVLNVVRALSLTSLILVLSSTIVDMNTNVQAVDAFHKDQDGFALVDCEYIEGSSVPNQLGGVIWAYMASLLTIFQTVILALSEVGWNMTFFDRYFPVLGSNFGLGILGIFQCLITTNILSHFVEDFTLVSAFGLFVIGCLNILLGLIFRESARAKRSINPLRTGVKGVLPTSQDNRLVFPIFSSRKSSSGKITPYVFRQDTTSSDNGS